MLHTSHPITYITGVTEFSNVYFKNRKKRRWISLMPYVKVSSHENIFTLPFPSHPPSPLPLWLCFDVFLLCFVLNYTIKRHYTAKVLPWFFVMSNNLMSITGTNFQIDFSKINHCLYFRNDYKCNTHKKCIK